MNMPIDMSALMIVIVVSGFLLAIVAAGIVFVYVSALIIHYFPNCFYSKWLDREFSQSEPLSHNTSDWLSERMRK